MTPTAPHTSEPPTSTSATALMSPENAATASRGKRENVQVKAGRLLLTGRLRVLRVEGNLIVAECRGDSGEVYKLGHEPWARMPWRCTCPARTVCSHLHALWAVTAVER
jgi:uncharacterized Zn finger protein